MRKSLKIFFVLIFTALVVLIFTRKVEAREAYNSDI